MRENFIGTLKVLFSLFLIFIIFSSGAEASEHGKYEFDIEQSELQKSIEFRKKFGLQTDSSFVSNVINKKEPNKSFEKFGVWLTNDEMEELESRIKHQEEKIPQIIDYINTNLGEDIFGGLTVDQSKKGILTIYLTEDLKNVDKEIKEIKHIFKDDAKIKFKKVKKSEKELEKLHKKIYTKKNELTDYGVNITSINNNIDENKVEIGIYPYSLQAVQYLKDTFGEDITVIENNVKIEKESRTAYTRPLKGGLRIYNIDNGSSCTGGFSASLGSWVYYVTAGHCGGSNDRFSQGGQYFGTVYVSKDSDNIDAMLITLGQLSYASNDNYGSSDFTSWQDESYEYVGQAVKMNGSYSGHTTGVVKSTYFSVGGHYDMTAADYYSQSGDSGSPTYYGSQIRGVHNGVVTSGQYAGWKFFTHVHNMVNYWGLSPITW
jgi:hypothetical protein